MNNIFLEIMNLIEKKTDMPMLLKDCEEWVSKSEENRSIFEIYKTASYARNLDNDNE